MSIQTTSPHPASALRRPRPRPTSPSRSVAAVIMEDGTIHPVGDRKRSRVTPGSHGWSNGSISGDGWIIWWERRELD